MVFILPREFEETLRLRCKFLEILTVEENNARLYKDKVPRGKVRIYCIYFEPR
jgi:ADP-ribose pyrophosphatase YjhB (NUDIX family)